MQSLVQVEKNVVIGTDGTITTEDPSASVDTSGGIVLPTDSADTVSVMDSEGNPYVVTPKAVRDYVAANAGSGGGSTTPATTGECDFQ